MDDSNGPQADDGPRIHETMARRLRGIGSEFVIVVVDTVRIPFIEAQEESRRSLGSVAMATAPLRDSMAIVAAIDRVGSYLTLDANTSAIEYLTSTGQLQLIGNERLRSAILTYTTRSRT